MCLCVWAQVKADYAWSKSRKSARGSVLGKIARGSISLQKLEVENEESVKEVLLKRIFGIGRAEHGQVCVLQCVAIRSNVLEGVAVRIGVHVFKRSVVKTVVVCSSNSYEHSCPLQVGEDALDAVGCWSLSAKEPLIIGFFLRKMTYKEKESYTSSPPCAIISRPDRPDRHARCMDTRAHTHTHSLSLTHASLSCGWFSLSLIFVLIWLAVDCFM